MNIDQIREYVELVNYKDWDFLVKLDGDRVYLQVEFWAKDSYTDEYLVQRGRKWMLSEHMTKSEIINTCWLAVQTAEMHEMRETFTYRGRTIYGPHTDVDTLAEVVRKMDNLDIRSDPVSARLFEREESDG